jgi:hypothetical protein
MTSVQLADGCVFDVNHHFRIGGFSLVHYSAKGLRVCRGVCPTAEVARCEAVSWGNGRAEAFSACCWLFEFLPAMLHHCHHSDGAAELAS